MVDVHALIARLSAQAPRLDLRTVDLCFLVAMRVRTQDRVQSELDADALADLYVEMVEVVEGGERMARRLASDALERLRSNGILARVDGAGLVRAGDFALTRLGAVIADTYLEEETLTRQSLVLLTRQLRSTLARVRTEAERAVDPEAWDEVRASLNVTVSSLVEGIDRRRRGLDAQQAQIRMQIGELLKETWSGAIEACEVLLDQTTETLAELNEVLMGEASGLTTVLIEIESFAERARADEAAEAARTAQSSIGNVAAWGGARHQAWSEFFSFVQRYLRDIVRLDPDRALSRRLQDALAAWPEERWAFTVPSPRPYRHLRTLKAEVLAPPVRRAAIARERIIDDVAPERTREALETLVLDDLVAYPDTCLADLLCRVLPQTPPNGRFRTIGQITHLVAQHVSVEIARPRPWRAVDKYEVEDWKIIHD